MIQECGWFRLQSYFFYLAMNFTGFRSDWISWTNREGPKTTSNLIQSRTWSIRKQLIQIVKIFYSLFQIVKTFFSNPPHQSQNTSSVQKVHFNHIRIPTAIINSDNYFSPSKNLPSFCIENSSSPRHRCDKKEKIYNSCLLSTPPLSRRHAKNPRLVFPDAKN